MYAAPVRAVTGAPVTVTFTPVDSDGEPSAVDPGVVTVNVVRADGTAVATGAATGVSGVTRSYTLSASATALLDQLTVSWIASSVTIGTTVVDVVGGVFATVAEIRATMPSLVDPAKYPNAVLRDARLEVETMFQRGIGDSLSFVPRFDTVSLYHRGQRMLKVPHYFLRRVRWARYWYDEATSTDVTGSLLTGIQANDAGLAILYDSTESWPTGRLVVGYEHGMDAPPVDVKRQAITAIRRQANQANTGADSRAISYTTPTGEVQRFPTPGLGPWTTGLPEVDEVLRWYRERYPVSAAVA